MTVPAERGDAAPDVVAGHTLPELLAARAAASPQLVAMRRFTGSGTQEISWAESHANTSSLTAALRRRGIAPGDVIVVVGPPAPEMFWTAYAAWALGAVVVGMWPGAGAAAVEGLATSTAARMIVATDAELARSLAAAAPSSGRPVVVDAAWPSDPVAPGDTPVPVARLLRDGAGTGGLPRGLVSPDTTAAYFRTSGSTGEPKSAAHTHASLIAGTQVFLAKFPAGHDDDHVPNFNLAAPAEPVVGTVNHLITGLRMNFSAGPMSYEELIRNVSPVYLWTMPPTWLRRAAIVREALQRESGADGGPDDASTEAARQVLGATRTRWAISGGTALSADVIGLLQSIGLPLYKIYASAEMLITMSGLCDAAVTDGIGTPLPGVEAEVDIFSQLRIRFDGLFTGYAGNPVATAAAFTSDGWYLTGDASWVDEAGEFRFIGRMSDLTRRQDGTVMSPQLIESRLKDSKLISEAVAVSAPSGAVLALLDVDAGLLRAELSADAADLFASAQVAELIDAAVAEANAGLPPGSRVIRYVCLRDSLSADRDELTATGKIRRGIVLEHYRTLIEKLAGSTSTGRPDVGRAARP